ncbi:MAG: hypothetical protein B5M51_03250 [Anaerolinea sp. 4484_236]|nr:MAG: hypothetical protein B5M51_03250 [Anaerolinea sp. 4484_236]
MFILITITILFTTALALLILHWGRPDFRATWLVAVGGASLAWISVFLWQLKMPLVLTLPAWQPELLFVDSPVFVADGLSWPYAISLTTLALGALLTSIVRENFPNPPAWAGILTLTGMGMLAVLADNPLTLALTWAAIDLVELITLLGSVNGKKLRERVVVAFATRVVGLGFLLWAGFVSSAAGSSLNFIAAPTQAGLYMLVAASLRLGVLPMHLPFTMETALRRGYGTALRLISAASSLILLARIPASSVKSPWTPFLFVLVALAALYSGWIWFRSMNTLDARPYWLIGMGSLAVASALRANPAGSVAWGCALILGGGALFLSSIQQKWLTRLLLAGILGMTSLPFTLTASGWVSKTEIWWGFGLVFFPAQAFLLAGYVRHARRATENKFETQHKSARLVYPVGIALMLLIMFLLGVWGWRGAQTIGFWWMGFAATLLTITLLWLRPRVRMLTPPQAHWLKPAASNLDQLYGILWNFYLILRRFSAFITKVLESDGGILWTLLFIVLFASLLAGGMR